MVQPGTSTSELASSSVTRITGQTELLAADVVTRADGKQALCVENSRGPFHSYWTSNLRYIDMSDINGGVARNTIISTTQVTIFSYTGSGFFAGFILNLETFTLWEVELLVDGFSIFKILTDEMSSETTYDVDDIADVNQAFLGLTKSSHDRLVYHPPLNYPIRYNSSVAIKIKRVSGTKKFSAGLVILSKEVVYD